MNKNNKRNFKQEPTIPQAVVAVKIPFWHKLIPPAILSIITTVFYYRSLKYPFQFDDLANITKKFDIRFADPLSSWWRCRRWMGEWLNRLNFEWGRFDPFGYRLTNLTIHILTGILVFFLVLEGCAYLKKRTFFAKYAMAIATTTAALFMLHPVQTQAVSYTIQGRLEGVATLLIVATLFLFLKAFQSQNTLVRFSLIALCFLVGFISCGTKEIAIVSPFLALLVDWFFIAEESWENLKSRWWFHAIFAFIIFATFVHYMTPQFFTDVAKLNITTANNRGNILTQNAHDIIKPFDFLISEFKVILHYLMIFIWPFSLSVEYDWKLTESFFSPDCFFPFVLLLALFILACYSIIKKQFGFFGFGFLWFFVAIAPRSTIIPSPELICDYKTYLSSIGWLFILATGIVAGLSYLIETIPTLSIFARPVPQLAAIIILSLPVGYGLMERNIVWSSSVEFWKDIVVKAPIKARGHNNLGVALSEEGNFEAAIPHYLEAIRLDRCYSDPWSNLAVAYSVKEETDKAIGALREAIRIFPNYPEAYNNLGTLMIKKKNYEAAEQILNIALKLRPYYGKAFYNFGRLYIDKGDMVKAWEYFKKATEGDLDTTEGFYTLGQMSLKVQKYDEAVHAFTMALQRANNVAQEQRDQILFNLGNSYFMLKNYDQAVPVFEALCQKYPNEHRYWYNLAETLYTKKDFIRAAELFDKLSKPPFGILQANFRSAHCLEKLNRGEEARSLFTALAQAPNVPDDYKKMATNELGRLNIQQKINAGNCTLTMKDLQQAFKPKA